MHDRTFNIDMSDSRKDTSNHLSDPLDVFDFKNLAKESKLALSLKKNLWLNLYLPINLRLFKRLRVLLKGLAIFTDYLLTF